MMNTDSRRPSVAALFAPTTTLPRPLISLLTPILSIALSLPLLLALVMLPTGCASASGVQTGTASYYHDKFHGRKTASGAAYNKNAMTAAHKHLPLGTVVRVTDLNTGRSVEVLINDRGPFTKGRVIDLSRRAATELGMVGRGTAKVKVEVVGSAKRRGA